MTRPRSEHYLAVSAGLLLCHLVVEGLMRLVDSIEVAMGPLLALDAAAVLGALVALCRKPAGRISSAVQAERQRIARDLHDGLGFHLTTALTLAREGKDAGDGVRLAVELAILELHSVVHFAHSQGLPVVDAMASLRYRIQPVAEQQGLELAWQVDDDIPEEALRGNAAHHVVKVVQEALGNVLKHARATRLEVSLHRSQCGRQLSLEIRDNGCGLMASGPQRRGHGLEAMRRRADLLGAELAVTSEETGGTCVRLVVPLPRARRPGP
jgi:two-component system sensor histidine kinase DevS